MLKKFVLKNYKNFEKEIAVDFQKVAGYQFSTDCISDGIISKMLIYGRNATGKTNLGKAFLDIVSMLFHVYPHNDTGIFLNADSAEKYAFFSYTFLFGENEIIYQYTKSLNQELRDEELIVDGIRIFKCNFSDRQYSFDHLKYIDAETVMIERYLQSLAEGDSSEGMIYGKLPFLRWVISNAALKNASPLLRMSDYVRRMFMLTVSDTAMHRTRRMYDNFFKSLEKPENLGDFEEFLNVMGIDCKLILKKLPDGQQELYFGHSRLVPFYENASSGTLALTNLYQMCVIVGKKASFLYLDEFDAFYHYEMAENVIRFFKKKFSECQIIMTSHNTNLMTNRLMRPDCLFILSGKGELTSLCNATLRELREGHNLEKMYISGEFEKYE